MSVATYGGDPEKHHVRRAFSRAADGYDSLATLQRQVADEVLTALPAFEQPPRRILDLGTGTGYCLPRLCASFPEAQVIAIDLAEGMLRRVRQAVAASEQVWLVNGDAERLPVADESVDLVVSSLALQWCPDLQAALGECARVLAPGGWLVYTTFGSRTLAELRQAWAGVDDHSHVNRFSSESGMRSALAAAGLADVRLDADLRVACYPDVFALMNELKGLGAHNVTVNRPRALTGKRRLQAMVARYRELHACEDGRIQASFEVLVGSARRMVPRR